MFQKDHPGDGQNLKRVVTKVLDACTSGTIPEMQLLSCISRCGNVAPFELHHGDTCNAARNIDWEFTSELTRSDVLLRRGKREIYWSWSESTGFIFETID